MTMKRFTVPGYKFYINACIGKLLLHSLIVCISISAKAQIFSVDSKVQAWQQTGIYVSGGKKFKISPDNSSLGTFIATNGPETGSLVSTVIYNVGSGHQVSLNGNRYYANKQWFSNIGTVPSGPHGWTGLSPNHTGFVLRFIGFVDANFNGIYDFSIDHYLGAIDQSLTIVPQVSGDLYMTFYDDGPYDDNSGILSFRKCSDTVFIDTIACNPFIWNNIIITEDGVYSALIKSSTGCDSIAVMDVRFNEHKHNFTIVESCDPYLWRGRYINETGIYSDTLSTVSNCDSIVSLDLTIRGLVMIEDYISVCDSFSWRGSQLIQSGTYHDTLYSSSGCDTIMTLFLDLSSSSRKKSFVRGCDQFTWALNGKTYYSDAIDTTYLSNAYGCDSIIVLEVKISSSEVFKDSVAAVNSYYWPLTGETYFSSGIYSVSYPNVSGCDSMQILVLEILPGPNYFAPNTFSPNGDGINDSFTIFGNMEVSEIALLQIYDRWGNLLFYKKGLMPNDVIDGWDGTFNGEPMGPGVYVFHADLLFVHGGSVTLKGDVHLIR